MKRKFLNSFLSIVFFTFLLFAQSSTKVLAKDNTFDCGVGKRTGTCAVHANRCNKTYEPDVSICASISDLNKCRATTSKPCIPNLSAGSTLCEDGSGIRTAIGCIHVFDSQESFTSDILKWAVGIGGGIAFALMLYAGFMIMTASGNPERIKAGQELLTSAVAGLILLVFSVFILRFIGVDILGLNQFGFNQ